MVRLKAVFIGCIANGSCIFQFLYGAIKSNLTDAEKLALQQFQFLYGAIKSEGREDLGNVFEGELTDVKLKELIFEAKKIMKPETDSLIIFKSRQEKWLEKQVIGKEKNELDNLL